MSAGTATGRATQARESILAFLTARTTHDLNNHLATIIGKTEIAMMKNDPERWRRGLDDVYAAGQRSRDTVRDFQELHGWVTRGSRDAAPLGDIVTVVVRLLTRKLERAGVALQTSYVPPARVTLLGDVGLVLWGQTFCLAKGMRARNTTTLWSISGTPPAKGTVELSLEHPHAEVASAAADVMALRDALGGLATSTGIDVTTQGETTRFTIPA
jgi:hypothetical protein